MLTIKKMPIWIMLVFSFFAIDTLAQTTAPSCHFELETQFPKTGPNLQHEYRVDQAHLLEVFFDDNCVLIQIDLTKESKGSDRADGSDSEKIPDLSMDSYKDILRSIEEKYPLGNYIESDTISISSPSGNVSWSKYENALLQNVFYAVNDKEKLVGYIVSFSIRYRHEVTGKLTDQFVLDDSSCFKRSKISFGDKSYWSDPLSSSKMEQTKSDVYEVYGLPVQ